MTTMQVKLQEAMEEATWLKEVYERKPVPISDRYFAMVDQARDFLVVLRKTAIGGYHLSIEDVASVIVAFDAVDAKAERMGIKFPKMPMLKDRFAKQLSKLFDIAIQQQRMTTPLVSVGSVPRKEKVVST